MKKSLSLLVIIVIFISCSPSNSKIKNLVIKCSSSTVNIKNFKITAKNRSVMTVSGYGTEYRYSGVFVNKKGKKIERNGKIFLADTGHISGCDETWK